MSEQPQSDEEILRALNESEKNRAWLTENYEKLRNQYRGKVFAVRDSKVVASKDSITELVDEIKTKKEDSPVLLVESIPPKGVVYIL